MKRNKNYIKALKIIKYDSKQSGVSIKELCNDMVYNMELADSLEIALENMVIITNKIEKEC